MNDIRQRAARLADYFKDEAFSADTDREVEHAQSVERLLRMVAGARIHEVHDGEVSGTVPDDWHGRRILVISLDEEKAGR